MDTAYEAARESLDQCTSLYLRNIEPHGDYGVRLRVEQPASHPQYESLDRDFTPELSARLRKTSPQCETFKERLLFEITFPEVISYTVTTEDYLKKSEAPEAFTGQWLRVFSWSYFLELTKKTTFAEDDDKLGPVQHFQIACFDSHVDVIGYQSPEVRQIMPELMNERLASNLGAPN